jgi:tetratricopeptide (TPR) repeat protein
MYLGDNEMNQTGKEDPIRIHKEGTALHDSGNYEEAAQKFLYASQLYEKANNFFDASYTLFKAAECNFLQKDYETAIERFLKAADIALGKGFDRFGLGALEYALDCYKAAEKETDIDVSELKKRIAEVKKKLETQGF